MSNERFSEADWRRLLSSLGENPDRSGLTETPARVARAWEHWCAGYRTDPKEIFKVFEDGAEHYNQLIVIRNIPVYSHCEHHLAPFFGSATIGYLPNGKIVGLSKFTRLVHCLARRLQVQERLTQQIATTIMDVLAPKAVGVIVNCRHMCMESRGICTPGEETITSAMLGELEHNLALRTEFLNLARAACPMGNTVFGLTESQISHYGLTIGVIALMLYMLFIIGELAWRSA